MESLEVEYEKPSGVWKHGFQINTMLTQLVSRTSRMPEGSGLSSVTAEVNFYNH